MTSHDDDDENKKLELKKVVQAIHISGTLTLSQQKIYDLMLFYSLPDVAEKEVFSVPYSRLVKDMDYGSNNSFHLKEEVRGLMSHVLEWNLLGYRDDEKEKNRSGKATRKNENDFRLSNLVAEAELSGGILSWSFAPKVRALLADSTSQFSIVDLQMAKEFKTAKAYSLYKTCQRFKNVGSTGWIPLDIFKKLLGISDDDLSYREFKHFNHLVLKPVKKEIDEVSDLEIEYHFKRENRRIVAIKCTIKIKTKNIGAGQPPEPSKLEVLRRLTNLGISERAAQKYIKEESLDYLIGNLDVVEERIRSQPLGAIRNYPRYFKRAIEEDWRPVVPPIDLERQAEAEAKKLAQAEAERMQEDNRVAQENEKKAKRAQEEEKFNALSPEEQKDVLSHFEKFLRTKNMPHIIEKGLKNKVYHSYLLNWMAGFEV